MKRLLSSIAGWAGQAVVWGFRTLGFRGVLFVALCILLFGGYARWNRDREALVAKQQEIIFRDSLIIQLQEVIGSSTAERRAVDRMLDSARMVGSEYATQSAFWRDRVAGIQGVVADQQNYVRYLERANDSLRRSRVVYVDRCWNALGREVRCKKR